MEKGWRSLDKVTSVYDGFVFGFNVLIDFVGFYIGSKPLYVMKKLLLFGYKLEDAL